MIIEGAGYLAGCLQAALIMLSVALILALIRIFLGPSLPDRVAALDLIATIAIGLIASYSISTDQAVFLSPALALALLSFLGTVAFARYISNGGKP